MEQMMFYVLFGCALLFLMIMVRWKSISLGLLDVVLWWILSVAVFYIEIPYVAIQSDDAIVTGMHTVDSLYILSPLFIAFGVITLVYWLINIVFPTLSGNSKMM